MPPPDPPFPGTPISQLPSAGTLTGAELVPCDQDSITVKTTAQDIADLASGGASSVTITDGVQTDLNLHTLTIGNGLTLTLGTGLDTGSDTIDNSQSDSMQFSGCEYQNLSAQSIPATLPSLLFWPDMVYDTNSYGSNSTVFVAPFDGWYTAGCVVEWDDTYTPPLYSVLGLLVNGTSAFYADERVISDSGYPTTLSVSGDVLLSAGDSITFSVVHNQSGALDAIPQSMYIHRLSGSDTNSGGGSTTFSLTDGTNTDTVGTGSVIHFDGATVSSGTGNPTVTVTPPANPVIGWCYFAVSGGACINVQGPNIASVVYNSIGNYTINFTMPLPNTFQALYSVSVASLLNGVVVSTDNMGGTYCTLNFSANAPTEVNALTVLFLN